MDGAVVAPQHLSQPFLVVVLVVLKPVFQIVLQKEFDVSRRQFVERHRRRAEHRGHLRIQLVGLLPVEQSFDGGRNVSDRDRSQHMPRSEDLMRVPLRLWQRSLEVANPTQQQSLVPFVRCRESSDFVVVLIQQRCGEPKIFQQLRPRAEVVSQRGHAYVEKLVDSTS